MPWFVPWTAHVLMTSPRHLRPAVFVGSAAQGAPVSPSHRGCVCGECVSRDFIIVGGEDPVLHRGRVPCAVEATPTEVRVPGLVSSRASANYALQVPLLRVAWAADLGSFQHRVPHAVL